MVLIAISTHAPHSAEARVLVSGGNAGVTSMCGISNTEVEYLPECLWTTTVNRC